MEICGKPMRVKVAHVRLCASRACIASLSPRDTECCSTRMREALLAGVASDDVIGQHPGPPREPPRPLTIVTPEDLALRHPPRADCNRYDSLRGLHAAA